MPGSTLPAVEPAPVPLSLQLEALVMLSLARPLLRGIGTAGTLRRLARPARTQGRPVSHASALRAVRRAARLTGGACLPQAVALTAILTRAGEGPTLVLGSRRYDEAKWGAHAWVDADGELLDPLPGLDHHRPLGAYRSADGWKLGRPA
ncbi:MAG: Transglutaminase-like superfamily [Actinomycetota bacterium]